MEHTTSTVVSWVMAALLVLTIGWHIHTVQNLEQTLAEVKAQQQTAQKTTPPPGSHLMPDGSIMSNNPETPSMSMADMMHDMNASLRGKSGDELDKTFLSEMIVHHQGAVDMAKMVLDSKHPELAKLAQDIISAQEKEISLMKQWQEEWFK